MFSIAPMNNVADQYYLFLYSLQHYLYHSLFIGTSSQNIFLSFIFCSLGFSTIFTPCFISLLPLSISYLNSNEYQGLSKSLFFFGFLSSSCLIVFFSHFVNFYSILYKLPLLSYLILILSSLSLMKILNFSKIYNYVNKKLMVSSNQNIIFKSYSMGLIIGFSSLPCNTSIIVLVTSWLENTNNVFIFTFYLLSYLCGFLIPLVTIFNLRINKINIYGIKFIWDLLFPLSGSFLFVFSFFSFLKIIFI
uniref:Thiol:disulfide interchange protein n=1 Tax=Rhodomela confervoides TaxID=35163 RepID=A0A1Z1M9G1_RHOCN|nr:thiol:disulfide interchange protein [Rhodomela confervoides]ARW62616.1 thiol:disulfide interchange protein [Rhodomela confervoides]